MRSDTVEDQVALVGDPPESRLVLRRVLSWFAIDVRALAALRIALALVMLYDLANRYTHLLEYYVDDGYCPRAVFGTVRYHSLYFLSGSASFVRALFALHAVLALMLLVGYRTRLATAGCALMMWSLTSRNPLLIHSGDNLVAWLLIWSVFLPLGARGSVDSRTAARGAAAMPGTSRQPPLREVCSVASAAMILQVVMMYIVSALAKEVPGWRSEFTAVHIYLASHYGTPLGRLLDRTQGLTRLLTVSTLLLEFVGPLAAVATVRLPWVRTGIALVFMLFHLGLGATLYIGTFAWVCMAAWLPYVPGPAWDVLLSNGPLRLLARAWGRLIDMLARAVEMLSHAAPFVAVRRIRSGESSVALAVVVGLLLGYAGWINLCESVPTSLARAMGPLARLPRMRQVWAVMGTLPDAKNILVVRGTLADGSTLELSTAEELLPPQQQRGWRLLWPPDDARLVSFRQRILRHTVDGHNDDMIRAYCGYARRRANRGLDADHQVVAVTALFYYHELQPIGASGDFAAPPVFKPIYSWPESAAVNGRP